MAQQFVIIGASLAGLRAAQRLRLDGHDGPIIMVGGESHRPYDRPPLSKEVLTGKVGADSTGLPVPDDLDVTWMLGTVATGLDVHNSRVRLGDAEEIPFDGLVLATGAQPRILSLAPPGIGVHYLRTAEDAAALREDLTRSQGLAVIGAGFIGIEVACSAMEVGVSTVVLEALAVPLERALGTTVGSGLMGWHKAKGLDLRTGVSVQSILGDHTGRPEGLRLQDGSVVVADTIVVGVGVEPATRWLSDSGLDLADGICCDPCLRAQCGGRPVSNIVAAGDVARWEHPGYGRTVRIEHWTNATQSGEAAARTLLRGEEAEPYAPTPYFWSDQHGVKLQYVGHASEDDDTVVLEGGFDQDELLVAYGSKGRLTAALGIRRTRRVLALQRMIATGAEFPPA